MIGYSYVVTNSGNVTLTGPFSVADDKATVTCPDTASLAPSGTITCSASYTITQADLNVGSVINKATATGSFGSTPVTSNEATQTVTAEVSALLSIVKRATNPIVNSGGTVTFSITVTNDGNVDLTDVTVDDPLASDCDSTIGDLSVGSTSGPYTCTLTNVTADFTNTATVIGTTPLGGTVTDSDTAAVDVRPTISVAKTASATSVPEPGADVTYTVTVTNNSNEPVTITSLQDGWARQRLRTSLVTTTARWGPNWPPPARRRGSGLVHLPVHGHGERQPYPCCPRLRHRHRHGQGRGQ